jgi:hypothetical protein
MKRFQDLVPGAPRNNELPTSWDEVRSATLEAQAGWEKKLKESRASKAREWIRKMCNGLNNHATALKMLPTETEYVSVIAGAVTMVIKVRCRNILQRGSGRIGEQYENESILTIKRDRQPQTTSTFPRHLPRG